MEEQKEEEAKAEAELKAELDCTVSFKLLKIAQEIDIEFARIFELNFINRDPYTMAAVLSILETNNTAMISVGVITKMAQKSMEDSILASSNENVGRA